MTSFIGDLMTKYKTIQGATYIAFETLLIIGLIYLCITYPLSKLVGWFELGHLQQVEAAQEGGLAAAGGADDGDHLPLLDHYG